MKSYLKYAALLIGFLFINTGCYTTVNMSNRVTASYILCKSSSEYRLRHYTACRTYVDLYYYQPRTYVRYNTYTRYIQRSSPNTRGRVQSSVSTTRNNRTSTVRIIKPNRVTTRSTTPQTRRNRSAGNTRSTTRKN